MKWKLCKFDPRTATISLRRNFSALNLSTISSPPKKGCSMAEGFHLLHLPLDEYFVRTRIHTHKGEIPISIYIWSYRPINMLGTTWKEGIRRGYCRATWDRGRWGRPCPPWGRQPHPSAAAAGLSPEDQKLFNLFWSEDDYYFLGLKSANVKDVYIWKVIWFHLVWNVHIAWDKMRTVDRPWDVRPRREGWRCREGGRWTGSRSPRETGSASSATRSTPCSNKGI